MATPSLSTIYYTRMNAQTPDNSSAANCNNSWAFGLKANLLGQNISGSTGSEGPRPTASFWTCLGSSNGAAGVGLDGVDRWGTQFTASNYVHAASGSAHSWITLRSPTQLGPIFMTIDLNSATTTTMGIIFSKTTPYTTGTQLGRPMSVNEWAAGTLPATPIATTNAAMMTDNTTTGVQRTHFCCDVSGAFHYAFSKDTTGFFSSYLGLVQCDDAHVKDEYTLKTLFHSLNSGRGAPQGTTLRGGNGFSTRTPTGTVMGADGHLWWLFGANPVQGGIAAASVLSSAWNVFPLPVYSTVTTQQCYRGVLRDVWAIGTTTVGSTVLSASVVTHNVVGDYLIPFSVASSL